MFHSLFVTNTSVFFGQVEHLQVVLAVARAALALPQPAEGQEIEEERQQHDETLPHLSLREPIHSDHPSPSRQRLDQHRVAKLSQLASAS